jgi:CRISPR-associated protein Cmr4
MTSSPFPSDAAGAPLSRFLWLRAETFIHVGAGETASLIDLPFARESGTSYPYIPGSGMKGAYRSLARVKYPAEVGEDEEKFKDDSRLLKLFGKEDQAGPLLVSDARIAFLPLRSLSSAFMLVTCPNLLRRLVRDQRLAGTLPTKQASFSDNFETWDDTKVQADPSHGSHLFIEEFKFERGDEEQWKTLQGGLAALLAGLDAVKGTLDRIAIVSDQDFGFFARRRLHVRARNRLLPISKTVSSGALWSEESLPPETLMYNIVSARAPSHGDAFNELLDLLNITGAGYLHVGGNETVGEGWFAVFGATP